jgi:putative addiction module component (TIGR02574 family)
MAVLTKAQIAALSIDERLALVDDIYESFRDNAEAFTPPDWHGEVLAKRLDEAERNRKASIPWEVVKAELIEKYGPWDSVD